MYIIGISDSQFVRVLKSRTYYDGKDIWSEIVFIEYNSPLQYAAMVADLESAEDLINELKDNFENINFQNHYPIAQILEGNNFDKNEYVKKLKIYEITPVLVKDAID